ncbi:MAG: Imm53 family immunity protein [Phycisphaerales bacterium]
MDCMIRLRNWWKSQCDGEWEHEFGIIIQTMDNPGWIVKIDIGHTALDDQDMRVISERRSPSDWCECRISDGTAWGSNETHLRHFVGMGGPDNLTDIIEYFLLFAESA